MLVVRWLLVVPLGILGVIAGFAVAIALVSIADALCPRELVVSGMCTAPWYGAAFDAATCAGAIVGAWFAVVLPAAVAPAHRKRIAALAFVLGAGYAAYALAAVGASLLLPFVLALVAGAIALLRTVRRA